MYIRDLLVVQSEKWIGYQFVVKQRRENRSGHYGLEPSFGSEGGIGKDCSVRLDFGGHLGFPTRVEHYFGLLPVN